MIFEEKFSSEFVQNIDRCFGDSFYDLKVKQVKRLLKWLSQKRWRQPHENELNVFEIYWSWLKFIEVSESKQIDLNGICEI